MLCAGKWHFRLGTRRRGNPQARKTSRVRSAVKCRAIGTRTKRNGSLIGPPPAPVFVFVSLLHLTEILLSPPFQGIRITAFSRSGSAMGTANSCASLGTFSGRAHMTAGASPRIACSLHAAVPRTGDVATVIPTDERESPRCFVGPICSTSIGPVSWPSAISTRRRSSLSSPGIPSSSATSSSEGLPCSLNP